VFPRRLRIALATEWRVCQYPGSRYRDDTPMNVTALKAMIKHWKPMMAVIVAVRDELQARLGLAPGDWTIGMLHHLSSGVCALPSFRLLQGGGSSPQVPLHPVLSSMFRVTDGIRMAMYEMLFDVKQTRRPEEVMTAAKLYAHVERNASLMASKTGVCAGPKHMIDEYLSAVIDGVGLDRYRGATQSPEVQALLDQLSAAIDYGLLSMQSWGLALAVWVAQSVAYEALIAIFDSAGHDDACAELRRRLRDDRALLGLAQVNLEDDRRVHMVPYACAYETSWQALAAPLGQPVHGDEIAVGPQGEMHRVAANQLRAILVDRLAGSQLVTGAAPAVERIIDVLVSYLREEQAVLAPVVARQAAINALLDRPRPRRPLAVRDLRTVYMLNGAERPYPHLLDTLEAALDLKIECTASALTVSDLRLG
jgi:hypothetical protein